MILYGKNSILERLRRNPGTIQKIMLQENFDDPRFMKLIHRKEVLIERVKPRRLARMKPYDNLQGVAAKVSAFEYTEFRDLLKRGTGRRPTIIFLERIYDPRNVGAIIRTAANFGRCAIVLPKHRACEINESVLHVAAGGENYVPIAAVSNITTAIIAAKKSGYWVAGAVFDNAEDLRKVDLPFPLGIVLGSEGEGVRSGIEKHLDIRARIPMEGAQLSFNVSVACAIFIYEMSRKRIL
ncbi:MAG: 23S rRNA (guanosine(2251)-2'-O)-methyltransferase RlmB [Candidatus Omnitrophota bacterium]